MLQDVALTLDEGERVVIVGRSGEGKSTLLAALAAYAGGQGAVVPQAASLVPLSVFHNVHMGRLDRHGSWSNLRELIAPSRAARAAVEALLESLRLGGASRAPAMTLSGGQQQRVAIARALIASRPLLFADEPVSALARREGREILGVMRGLAPTSVTVLHDLSLTLGHATRVLALRDGRVALDAPASALAERDLAPFFDRR